jgi:hypothetical protein
MSNTSVISNGSVISNEKIIRIHNTKHLRNIQNTTTIYRADMTHDEAKALMEDCMRVSLPICIVVGQQPKWNL